MQVALIATPASLFVKAVRNDQTFLSFVLENAGTATATNVQVLIPSLPFLDIVAPALGRLAELAPATAVTVTLSLMPTNATSLQVFNGQLGILCTQQSALLRLRIEVASDACGFVRPAQCYIVHCVA